MRSLLLNYGPTLLLIVALGYEYFNHGTTSLLLLMGIALVVRFFIGGSRKSLNMLGKESRHWSGALLLWDILVVALAVYSFIV